MGKVQHLQNCLHDKTFLSSDATSLVGRRDFVQDKNGNPSSPHTYKLIFPNLNKLYSLYILVGFYLVLSRDVCLRFLMLSSQGMWFQSVILVSSDKGLIMHAHFNDSNFSLHFYNFLFHPFMFGKLFFLSFLTQMNLLCLENHSTTVV